MLKKNLNLDTDDEPHTLRSDLPSNRISICKPSHLSSLASNPLQISQSPTRGFLTQEHRNLPNEISQCGLVPPDIPDFSHTTKKTDSTSNTFAETKNMGKSILVSEGKRDDDDKEQEQKSLPSTEDEVRVSPAPPSNPFAGLCHDPPSGTSFHDQSNPLCAPSSNIGSSPYEGHSMSSFVAPFPAASSSDLLSSLKFFSFVILHVPEDQTEAMRVRNILHDLEVGEGTTFCEGFETAGVSPLKCLEDAVENSAYIVLLLTTGFLSKWGEFQTNTVLMNSIDNLTKEGTVIPFIPKFKTPVGKIPLSLKSLIPLDESSPLFDSRVRNTFKQDMIKRQQERWRKEQVSKALEKKLEEAKDLCDDEEIKQRIAMKLAYYTHLTDYMSLLSLPPQQIIPGHGSVIHINNASNVQIGNNNSMSVQQTTNVPQMELPGESYQECDQESQS